MAHGQAMRLEIEGAWYHVINRGLDKRLIFPDQCADAHFLDGPRPAECALGPAFHAFASFLERLSETDRLFRTLDKVRASACDLEKI